MVATKINTMKKLSFLIIFIVIAFMGCTPDNDFTVGTKQDRVKQLSGTWTLTSVTQTDLFAKNYNYNDPSNPNVNLISQNISGIAPFSNIKLTLGLNGTAPGTFTIDYGSAPPVFNLTAGTWALDNNITPGKLNLINGTDTTKLVLYNLNYLSANQFGLSRIRYEGAKPVIQYDYAFQKN